MSGTNADRPPRPALTGYLVRAVRDWIIDSAMTPEMIVNATLDGVEVPRWLAANETLVLNVSDDATQGLAIGNEWVTMSTRFNGVAHSVRLPLRAVRGMQIRETGESIAMAQVQPDPSAEPEPEPKRKRPALRVVK